MILIDRLGQIDVLDTLGETVRLGTVWEQGTTVLTFVRHFG